ncbi:MAG: PDGLE domain-containing protein, partial [bacterium]
VVGTILSPFASSWPDGLESVAENFGFIHKGEVKSLVAAPIPDYSFPGIDNHFISTALAGFFGTIISFVVTYGLLLTIRSLKRRS